LLVAMGLVVRAQDRMLKPPLGYDPQAVIVASIDFTRLGYSAWAARAFYDQLLPRLEAMPGVTEVALSSFPPFQGANRTPVTAEGRDTLFASSRVVSLNYFRVMGVRLVRGRLFSVVEAEASRWRTSALTSRTPVVVSESLAQRLWPDLDVVGRRLRLGNGADTEIVGVVADSSTLRPGEQDGPMLYQLADTSSLTTTTVLTRVTGDSRPVMQAVGPEVRALIPEVHVAPETIAATIAREAGQYSTVIAATAVASGLGLFLAFAGLAGMMTFAAVQRTQEIAVRLALGAQRRDIVGLFMWSLWRPLLRGLATGLPVAALSATLLRRANLLVDVKPTDPWPYGAAMVLLIVTVCVATLIPALSAARAEPSQALRNE
jgi:hypothetical protein